MPQSTQTATIQSIGRLSDGRWRIILEPDSFGFSIPSAQQLVYQNVATSSVKLDPYVNVANFENSDFNATPANAVETRLGTLYQDIDYSTATTTPVNFDALISGSATKASVPDSNYSTKRIIIPRYEGSRNTALHPDTGEAGSRFNLGNSFSDQSSASTYVAYYSFLSGSGASAPFTATMVIEYLISPEGELIDMINNKDNARLLEENFARNAYLKHSGASNGITVMSATPFSGSTGEEIFDFDRGIQILSGSSKLEVQGQRFIPPFPSSSQGGLLIPSGIELTSAKDLPQRARTILAEARII